MFCTYVLVGDVVLLQKGESVGDFLNHFFDVLYHKQFVCVQAGLEELLHRGLHILQK